jgi:hypothetical protein
MLKAQSDQRKQLGLHHFLKPVRVHANARPKRTVFKKTTDLSSTSGVTRTETCHPIFFFQMKEEGYLYPASYRLANVL